MGTPLDPEYFGGDSWKARVDRGLANFSDDRFLHANVRLIRQVMEHKESGLRVVVNISAEALLGFLAKRRYFNLYESPVIGGVRRGPSPERKQVDYLLGFHANAKDLYFGAVALGGTGIRFYGEYCMVLNSDKVADDTQILDRDSYDFLVPPLSDDPRMKVLVSEVLVGRWDADVIDRLTLRLLPELRGATRLITTGSVSEMVLHDQEFVEVHMINEDGITPRSIEEVRQSPDEIAIEARIEARGNAGFPPSAVELRWLQQRRSVVAALEREVIHSRIVTLHGRGYQWR